MQLFALYLLLVSALVQQALCELKWSYVDRKGEFTKITNWKGEYYALTTKNTLIQVPKSEDLGSPLNPKQIGSNIKDIASFSNTASQIHAFWAVDTGGQVLCLNQEGTHWSLVPIKELDSKAESVAVGSRNVVVLSETGIIYVSNSLHPNKDIKWHALKDVSPCRKVAVGSNEIFALGRDDDRRAAFLRIPIQTTEAESRPTVVATPGRFESIYASPVDDTLIGLNANGVMFALYKEYADWQQPRYAIAAKTRAYRMIYVKVLYAGNIVALQENVEKDKTNIHTLVNLEKYDTGIQAEQPMQMQGAHPVSGPSPASPAQPPPIGFIGDRYPQAPSQPYPQAPSGQLPQAPSGQLPQAPSGQLPQAPMQPAAAQQFPAEGTPQAAASPMAAASPLGAAVQPMAGGPEMRKPLVEEEPIIPKQMKLAQQPEAPQEQPAIGEETAPKKDEKAPQVPCKSEAGDFIPVPNVDAVLNPGMVVEGPKYEEAKGCPL